MVISGLGHIKRKTKLFLRTYNLSGQMGMKLFQNLENLHLILSLEFQ